MKCGAVQHSPQDKSLPEPSPWSPVCPYNPDNNSLLATRLHYYRPSWIKQFNKLFENFSLYLVNELLSHLRQIGFSYIPVLLECIIETECYIYVIKSFLFWEG